MDFQRERDQLLEDIIDYQDEPFEKIEYYSPIDTSPLLISRYFKNLNELTSRRVSVKQWVEEHFYSKRLEEPFQEMLERLRTVGDLDESYIRMIASRYSQDWQKLIMETGLTKNDRNWNLAIILYGSITFSTSAKMTLDDIMGDSMFDF